MMFYGLPNIETTLSSIDLLDHQHIEWQRVQRSTYLVHQRFRYDYPGPVSDLHQHLMILPAAHYGDQRLLDHHLKVSNSEAQTTYQYDDFGNTEITIFVPTIERSIDFEAWILVERNSAQGPYSVSADDLIATHFRNPTRLTQPDASMRSVAETFMESGAQDLELAQQINVWVYQTMQYAHNVTDIHTTAAQALALRQGVCQDYAHIMIALCHLCGIPARYVSGHLLGEGGTHAWVEVILPERHHPGLATIVPFDPTHGRRASISYVTIAIGRDYFDVPPTSGTFRASYTGQLSTSKHVGVATYEYADKPAQ